MNDVKIKPKIVYVSKDVKERLNKELIDNESYNSCLVRLIHELNLYKNFEKHLLVNKIKKGD